MRNLTGIMEAIQNAFTTGSSGVLYYSTVTASGNYPSAAGMVANWNAAYRYHFDASRQVATASENRTRAFGVFGCVCLGGA